MSKQLYRIINTLFGDGIGTLDEIDDLVHQDEFDNFDIVVDNFGDEIRLYATVIDMDSWDYKPPTHFDNWQNLDDGEYYLVIAEAID